MKTTKFLLLLCTCLVSSALFAQSVGVNDDNSTPSSSAMLHVKTTQKYEPIRMETNSYGGWMSIYKAGAYMGYMGIYNDQNGLDFGTSGSGTGNLNLVTGATPRLTIKNSGHVGIANATPQANLHVKTVGAIDYEPTWRLDAWGFNGSVIAECSSSNGALVTDNAGIVGYATGADLSQSEYNLGGYLKAQANSAYNYGSWTEGKGRSAQNIGTLGKAVGAQSTNYGGYFSARGDTSTNYGLYATVNNSNTFSTEFVSSIGATNYAGYFSGNVHVQGTLSKSAGTFRIDHPLDPANKYLVHSFVESPDMMNVYNGNVQTNGSGVAVVTLPDYFESLNKDFRYQLTCIGQFAQVIVLEEVKGNTFSIKTDKPNVKVSWQVTGVRKDVWAQAHPIVPEVEKVGVEKGKYLSPELYGKSDEYSVDPSRANSAKIAQERSK
jgi:hypothetical protein